MFYNNIQKAECLDREVRRRKRTLPNKVLTGRISKANAQREIKIMEEIAEEYRLAAQAEELAI
jgi:hypothetical protein